MAKKLMNTYVETKKIKIKDISAPSFEDRSELPEAHIENLRISMKQHGQLVPVWLRVVDGKYVRIAGRCRIEALIREGVKEVEADIFDVAEEQAYTLSTIENDHREGRPPLDRIRALVHQISVAYARLLKREGISTELSFDQVDEHEPLPTQSSGGLIIPLPLMAKMVSQVLLKMNTDSASSSIEDRLLKEAFDDTVRAYNVNEDWSKQQLRLFDLPPMILGQIDKGVLSIRAAIQLQKGRMRIKGRAKSFDRSDLGEERLDALKALMDYVYDACKNKPADQESAVSENQVKRKTDELLAEIKGYKSKAEALQRRYDELGRELKFADLSPREALAVDTLLKKLEKLIVKDSYE